VEYKIGKKLWGSFGLHDFNRGGGRAQVSFYLSDKLAANDFF
jgi:hypothetical protein